MASLIKRVELLKEANADIGKQAALYELSRRDPVFYFNHFCYTYDPRYGRGALPFNLHDFQEWFVLELKERIDLGVDIDIEKSRTMGVSWMIMLLFQWYWIFVPSSSFLVGSITENDVDQNLIDPEDTLFGKVRFNLQYQPKWIISKEQYHDKHLSLKNLVNGNSITGKAPTPSFGRSSRKKAILLDEAAFWQWARPAYNSASQTSPSRILVSTPNGKGGLYGERMCDKKAKRVTWPGRSEMVKKKGIWVPN